MCTVGLHGEIGQERLYLVRLELGHRGSVQRHAEWAEKGNGEPWHVSYCTEIDPQTQVEFWKLPIFLVKCHGNVTVIWYAGYQQYSLSDVAAGRCQRADQAL
jgi:hypothetical protein